MGKIGSAIDTSQGRARPLALVVDNERMTRRLVREALEQSGLNVREAESGAQAIELFGSDRPDIVLVDVGMPGMDGLTTCAALRGMFGGSWIPILLMTGVDDAESVAKACEQGATDFITKPASITILCHRVSYLLRGSSTLNALLKSETRLGLAQRIAKIGNWEWHPPTNRFIGSHESFRLIGMRPQDFGGTLEAFLNTVHPDDRSQIETALKGMVTHRTACDIDVRLVLPTGADFSVNVQAEVVHDDRIKSYSIVGTIQDISERKRSEREIHRLAYFDSLTGLPNRVLFKDRVTQALAHATRYHTIFATLFLDLDRFKVVNDTLGHNVGDLLLKSFADRLADSIRHSDSAGRDVASEPEQTLARLGGDEFTVLLTNLVDVQDAGKVARRILDALAQPFSIEGREIFVTVSVGIAIYPADGESVDALLKNSDSAMYHAKEQGQNNYQFYSNSMNAAAGARLALEGELRHAIERNELVVYYQPKVDLRTAAIVGAEALVRWQHAQQGLLLPDAFMPAAIDTGLIREIDEWVIQTVCRQQCVWQETGLSLVCVSVNVSNSLFHGNTLVAVVEESLRQTGLYARWLELELTESIVMRNVDASIAMLRRLKEMGVQLSIDDFGTGYSSLSYLQRLPLDMVKIDQSFIRDIVTQAEPASIVRAIIAMSHSLDLEVLAEGVEEEAQRKVLLEQRCDHAQGHLFGRPMPEEEFATWLSRNDLREAS